MNGQQAPFPWFGGKRKVAEEVWRRFGAVRNYVEPFFGSGAVLLNRPEPFIGGFGPETINDLDGFIANFWRAIKYDPLSTAAHADWPVNENDLHARHAWLIEQLETLQERLEGDPEFYDTKIAGWWAWGICCWIGSGFGSGKGPWRVVDGRLLKVGGDEKGVNRQLIHLGNNGQGVNKQIVHLSNKRVDLSDWFNALSLRLARVRVCSGDWSRLCGPSVTFKRGMTGFFLDPPYADTAHRTENLYSVDSLSVAHDVREWAIQEGDNPKMRIALCGYEGEHEMPESWDVYIWKAGSPFGTDNVNGKRERIWFSPHCLNKNQGSLF